MRKINTEKAMKELKFKVWDKVNKEWLVYKKWQIGWQGVKKLIAWVYVSQDNIAFNELQYCINNKNFIVVQFVKTHKGIDIYDGDILLYGRYKLRHTVVWKKTTCGYDLGWILTQTIEVAGNICENKELLKENRQ